MIIVSLFCLLEKRACHAGVGRGDGWIIPLGVYIDTEQFIPHDCSAFRNIGKYVFRSFTSHRYYTLIHDRIADAHCSCKQINSMMQTQRAKEKDLKMRLLPKKEK